MEVAVRDASAGRCGRLAAGERFITVAYILVKCS
jgi:hypothetical protein